MMTYPTYNPYVSQHLPYTPYVFTFDSGLQWNRPGMGDAATQITSQTLGAGASVMAAFGIATAASGPLAPFVAAAGALVGLFGQIFSGCGQTCTLASADADKVETILKQNIANYNASGHTYGEQQAALATFDYAWQQLENACGNPSLAAAGRNCISERMRGGCAAWQCNGCTAPGATVTRNSNGQCCGCDWFVLYRDPIANDPNVLGDASNPTGVYQAGATNTTTGGGSNIAGGNSGVIAGVSMQELAPILLAAGLLIAVMVIL